MFPAKRIGRLIFAAYEDVKRALTEGAVARRRVEEAVRASIAESAKSAPMAVEDAHAYMLAARTPREKRERSKEIEAKAWELMLAYDEKLDDGSRNPKRDKNLHQHGMDLLFATMGLRLRDAPRSSARSVPTTSPGYRQCTWCERPMYAYKQQWTGTHWSGAPTCEVCAKNRADNERVVSFNPDTILLPARDPSVPTEWHAPRRRRGR